MKKTLATILLILFTLPLSVFGATDIVNDATIKVDLVECWPLDESSGARTGASSNAYVLTDINSVGSGTGKDGETAADFENSGSEREYLARASDGAFDPGGDWSVSVWLKPETLSGDMQVIGKDDGSGSDNSRAWRVNTQGGGSGVAKGGAFYRSGTGVNTFDNQDSAELADDSWVHWVITVDVSATDIKQYINGFEVNATNIASAATSVWVGDAELSVGALGNDVGQFYDGLMQKLSFWSRAITSAEVTSIYDSGDVLPCIAVSGVEEVPQDHSYIISEVMLDRNVLVRTV